MLGYLAGCTAAGVIVGRAFGAFARAPFHYPLRQQDASLAHQAVIEALEVVEWPGLFALTLACSLALWAWSRPRSTPRRATGRPAALLFASLASVAAIIGFTAADRPGQALAALIAAGLGALVAAMLSTFWREAVGKARSIGASWLGQLPPAAGHLVATSAAALSLGYRGESALIQGIALLVGIGIFAGELALGLALAILANTLRVRTPQAGRASPHV